MTRNKPPFTLWPLSKLHDREIKLPSFLLKKATPWEGASSVPDSGPAPGTAGEPWMPVSPGASILGDLGSLSQNK